MDDLLGPDSKKDLIVQDGCIVSDMLVTDIVLHCVAWPSCGQ